MAYPILLRRIPARPHLHHPPPPQLSQFFAGVVFEEKTLYIARQVDGFAPLKYKKLREKFLKMIDLPTPASD